MKTPQGALDLKRWECMIPGRDKTIWEGALLKLEVNFPDGESETVMLRHEDKADARHRISDKTTKV